ncbi:sugar ABC transporter substrate-binding protein [Amycolatopsis panacis]|nr:sugar ABC transporter substrate-binding protein [Amycolatopsis panacis]
MASKFLKAFAATAAGALVLALAVGCSSPSRDGGPASASAARPSSPQALSELNVGFFMTTTANPYAAIFSNAVQSAAKAAGVKLTEIDSNLDLQTQINQMQQAVARKTYNAWIVVPVDGAKVCNQVKAAINAGIRVMETNQYVCNGADIGQVGFTGWQTQETEAAWWKTILDQNSQAKVAFLAGPSTVGLVQSMKTQMETAFRDHPQASLVSYLNTDWSTQDGLRMTQDLLRAHPDVQVIVSSYSVVTRGAQQALAQAGLLGKVKVYDWAGDTWLVGQIQAGNVAMTLPGLPVSEGKASVDNLVAYWTGKPYPKVDTLTKGSALANGPYVTRQNAAGYEAQWTA